MQTDYKIPYVYARVERNDDTIFVFGGELEDKVYEVPVSISSGVDDITETSYPLGHVSIPMHTNRDPENRLYLLKVDKDTGEIISERSIPTLPSLTFGQGLRNLLTSGHWNDSYRRNVKKDREDFFNQLKKYESDEIS